MAGTGDVVAVKAAALGFTFSTPSDTTEQSSFVGDTEASSGSAVELVELDTFAEKGKALRSAFAEHAPEGDAGIGSGGKTGTKMLKPWAVELLHHAQYGAGAVECVSSTVILSNNLVLKATHTQEALALAQLNASSARGKVPVLVATFPLAAVFTTKPRHCDTVIMYRKIHGAPVSELATSLMKRYLDTQDAAVLGHIETLVRHAMDAAFQLFHAHGMVQQDLWLGNIVATNYTPNDYSTMQLHFLDVLDFTDASAPETLAGAVGGLLISTLSLLLGVPFFGVESGFSPSPLWKDMPGLWWVHTQWTTPELCHDEAKIAAADAVMRILMSVEAAPAAQVGLVTHLERFLGPRHAVLRKWQQELPSKFKFMSVKRAALTCGLMSKTSLADSISHVRGAGMWTLLRQELGKPAADEVRKAVVKKIAPVRTCSLVPCPQVTVPVTPPARGGCGTQMLPAHLVLRSPVRMPHEMHMSAHSPTHATFPSGEIDSEHVANLVTLEQVAVGGELSPELADRLCKWANSYGIEFKVDDFCHI